MVPIRFMDSKDSRKTYSSALFVGRLSAYSISVNVFE